MLGVVVVMVVLVLVESMPPRLPFDAVADCCSSSSSSSGPIVFDATCIDG